MELHEIQFPVKVVFKKTLFEDDFVEDGMIASFTGYEYNEDIDCCVLL